MIRNNASKLSLSRTVEHDSISSDSYQEEISPLLQIDMVDTQVLGVETPAKKDILTTLPELRENISNFLHTEDKINLSTTSRVIHSLFQADRFAIMAPKLLRHVARGEERMVERLFNISLANISCLLIPGNVQDHAGRVFFNITPFQYAIWALDWHMCKLMLNYLSKANSAGCREAEVVRLALLCQFNEVTTNGVNYMFNGIAVEGEHHFDFQPLISALRTLVLRSKQQGGDMIGQGLYPTRVPGFIGGGHLMPLPYLSSDRGSRDWCTIVGSAQKNVPAHVAQKYCKRAIWFFAKLLERTKPPRSIEFYNVLTDKRESWWPAEPLSKTLGVDFAICHGNSGALGGGGPDFGVNGPTGQIESDLTMLTDLAQKRTRQIARLGDDLLDLFDHVSDEAGHKSCCGLFR